MPTAWAFNQAIAEFLSAGGAAERRKLARLLTTGYARDGAPQVRFEQVIHVLRSVDPELAILRIFDETGAPNFLHHLLAHAISQKAMVFTTNFDSLIERALIAGWPELGADFAQVVFETRSSATDGMARRSFEGHLRARVTSPAVLKLHGTLRLFGSKFGRWLPDLSLQGIPSIGATLDKIGRASTELRLERFKEAVLARAIGGRVLCVLGYSGGDDFDVVPSLARHLRSARGLIWIRHEDRAVQVFDGTTPEGLSRLPAAIRGACAECPTMILCGNTGEIVSELFRFNKQSEKIELRNRRPVETVLLGYSPYTNMDPITRCILSARIAEEATDWSRALELYQRALRMAGKRKHVDQRFQILHRLGAMERAQGHYSQATRHLRHAIREAKGDHAQLGLAQNTLGTVYLDRGELDLAATQFRNALAAARRAGNDDLQTALLTNLGLVSRKRGRMRAALQYHKAALRLSTSLRMRNRMARDNGNIGSVYLRLKDYANARKFYGRAIKLARLTGTRDVLATVLMNQALVLKHLGKYADAERSAEDALKLEKSLGRSEGVARYWSLRAGIAQLRGRYLNAVRMLRKAIDIQRPLARREGLADDLESLGDCLMQAHRPEEARLAYKESHELFGELGNRQRQSALAKKLGSLRPSMGR